VGYSWTQLQVLRQQWQITTRSSFPQSSDCTLRPTKPPAWPVAIGFYSPVVKRPDREVDHSPQHCCEGKNAWTSNATFHYVVLGILGSEQWYYLYLKLVLKLLVITFMW
jgi:hypothetical protein